MFTRYQSQIIDSEPAYNTRLQARIRKAYGENKESISTNTNENIRMQFDIIDSNEVRNQTKKHIRQLYSYI